MKSVPGVVENFSCVWQKKEYTRAAASIDAQIIQNVSTYEIQVINQSGVRRRVADVFSISCRLQDIMLK